MVGTRKLGVVKSKPKVKPMSKSFLRLRLPTATHEDIERIRMLERQRIGNKGKVKPITRAPTREDREIAMALARQRERKGNLSKAQEKANLAKQKRAGFPYL